jgi:hypothetical protein
VLDPQGRMAGIIQPPLRAAGHRRRPDAHSPRHADRCSRSPPSPTSCRTACCPRWRAAGLFDEPARQAVADRHGRRASSTSNLSEAAEPDRRATRPSMRSSPAR